MKKFFGITISCLLILMGSSLTASAMEQQIGVGAHYWTEVEHTNIFDMDDSGMAFLVSYRNQLTSLMGFEVDLEVADKDYAGQGETVLAPQVFVFVGADIYAGVGIGVNYADGDFGSPYYLLRVGYNLEILPSIFLDINVNYRAEKWDVDAMAEDLSTETITLGAFVRIGF